MNMQMSDNPECGGHRIGDATEGIVIDFCRQLERELAVANSAYAAVEQVNLQMQEASRSATAGWKLMPEGYTPSDHGHRVTGRLDDYTAAYFATNGRWYTLDVKIPFLPEYVDSSEKNIVTGADGHGW